MILLDPQARPVIGHRGARASRPENTIPSLLEAVHMGADAVEFDVRITLDGIPVLMHDATLDRTTDSRGQLAGFTLKQLRTIDAGARFRDSSGGSTWKNRGVGIPTLDEAIETLPATLPMIIEIKTPEAAGAVRSAIRRHGAERRVIVAGFDAASTDCFASNECALGANQREIASLLLPSLLGIPVGKPRFQAMCIPPRWKGLPLPIGALKKLLGRYNIVTHVWTVNDASHARELWKHGVNGIISDDPSVILAAR